MTKVNGIDGSCREDNFLAMVGDNLHDSWFMKVSLSLSLSFFFLNLSHKEETRAPLPILSSCHFIWNKEKVTSHNEMRHCSTIDGNL